MDFKEKIIKLLNEQNRDDSFLVELSKSVSSVFEEIYNICNDFKNMLFFDRLPEQGIPYWEKLLNIVPTETQSLDDRRSMIEAKWNSVNHNDITLLQNICNAWKNGDVNVDFVKGKIKLIFVGEFGVPSDLDGLVNRLKEVYPCHLGFSYVFKYLLIENIHEVKTVEEMEQITLDQFAFGTV